MRSVREQAWDAKQGDREQRLRVQTQGLPAEPSDAAENFLRLLERKVDTHDTLI